MLYLVEQPPHCDLLRLSLSTGDLSALDGLFPSGFIFVIILKTSYISRTLFASIYILSYVFLFQGNLSFIFFLFLYDINQAYWRQQQHKLFIFISFNGDLSALDGLYPSVFFSNFFFDNFFYLQRSNNNNTNQNN